MTIIEFTGTPGCGKTSLCRALAEHMISRGHHAKDMSLGKSAGFWRKLKYRTFSVDKELKAALDEYLTTVPKDMLDQAKQMCDRILEFSYTLREEKAKKHHAHYALFDEGCVQFLALTAGDSELSEEAALLAETVKRRIYSGNKTVIVHCSVDEATNIRRLMKHPDRPDGFDSGTADEIAARLKLSERNILAAETDFAFRIRTEVTIDLVRNALDDLLAKLRGRESRHHHSEQPDDVEKAQTSTSTSVLMSLKDFNDGGATETE